MKRILVCLIIVSACISFICGYLLTSGARTDSLCAQPAQLQVVESIIIYGYV